MRKEPPIQQPQGIEGLLSKLEHEATFMDAAGKNAVKRCKALIRAHFAEQPAVELPFHASTGGDSFVTRLEKALHGARPQQKVSVSPRDLHDILYHFIRLDNAARNEIEAAYQLPAALQTTNAGAQIGTECRGCEPTDASSIEQVKALPPAPEQQPVDWTEDFEVRGNYQCRCHQCGCNFSGHKTRALCKVCALPPCPDIEPIRKLAREVGYAVGEHGSKVRDYDLIAAPWTDEAVGNYALIEHLCKGLNAKVVDGPSRKPCGRYAVCIQISGRWLKHIDLSIMPRLPEPESTPPAPHHIGDSNKMVCPREISDTAKFISGIRFISGMQQAWLDAFPDDVLHCKPVVSYAAMNGVYAYIKPYLRSPEPVSVSLEKCAEALAIFHGTIEQFGIREFQRNSAKAVLDAAGVKYVD